MLVNTSKVGQFTLPCPVNDVTTALTAMDSPWNQVLNYPSARNISTVKRLLPGRQTILRMKVDCTEDYVKRGGDDTVAWSYPLTSALTGVEATFNGLSPSAQWYIQYAANAASTSAQSLRAAQIQAGRRRFRWTKQWLLWSSSTSGDVPYMLYIRNDRKAAHGVQFMVKENTYWQSTVPYFNVHITAQVEFRGKLLQQLDDKVSINSQILFPWSNATYQTVG